ncbi:hypothetical protein MtrunA17_Chr3g0144541 [Medicago truncatula]|uniref:Transmembrane protein, putative n=1 Tax=Medicago truncatula TaxID=3880 RepID=G7J6L0_MEDTR|nr:transmembrane protein, putative [Medicago truncatula]RHN71285.1 hypothetical protein MtrunA17_Chr3g0144541 [Medicago truncatula]
MSRQQEKKKKKKKKKKEFSFRICIHVDTVYTNFALVVYTNLSFDFGGEEPFVLKPSLIVLFLQHQM